MTPDTAFQLYNRLCYCIIKFFPQPDNKIRTIPLIMRLKADLLLFTVAIIWGTAFVAQGVADVVIFIAVFILQFQGMELRYN